MSTTFWIIIAGAIATYLTRIGGHLVISRFEHIHPRVEAGLNAVPAAVLTTLVAPAAVDCRTGGMGGAGRHRGGLAARRPDGDVSGRRGGADRRAAVRGVGVSMFRLATRLQTAVSCAAGAHVEVRSCSGFTENAGGGLCRRDP